MKTELKVKFLQFLLGKKKDQNEGFTLIELLVVVIIIGVLAAVALPNMLGQVGKARESEAKTTIGALNRAQQARYTEKASFTSDLTQLEVPVNTNDTSKGYYTYKATGLGAQLANGNNNTANGTRDYAGATAYDTTNLTFSTVVCRATDTTALTSGATGGAGVAAASCATGLDQIK
jgi:type IV pilus assembly protein PilA